MLDLFPNIGQRSSITPNFLLASTRKFCDHFKKLLKGFVIPNATSAKVLIFVCGK